MINKKWFLYLTVFIAGMSIMAVELAANRLLAPYVSSSSIVWTIIIGVIMIALALGNIIGGRLADKKPNPSRLYLVLLISAIWIMLTPLFGKYVIGALSIIFAFIVSSNFLIWVTLFSCILIFGFPLLLLGMVSPTLIKTCIKDVENSGKTVGELNALSTVGSILGTFLPTFLVIPAFGTAATFIIFASLLFILSAIYFIELKKHLIKTVFAGVLIITLSINVRHLRFSLSKEYIVYEGESIYNYLLVRDENNLVSLSTNVLFGVQSVYYKDGLFHGNYYDYALAAPLMANYHQKEKIDVLILGLGSGTYASHLDKYFPKSNVTGVEIDKKIVDIAKEYFNLPESCNVHIGDGRSYLDQSGKYDVIMVDAYQDITIPFWMSTIEFFQMVKDHLTDDGVMVCNLNMTSQAEDSITNYLKDTINYVFDNTKIYQISSSTNSLVFTSKNQNFIDNLNEGIKNLDNYALINYMNRVKTNYENHIYKNKLLTDDKAPVELLGMKTLDEIINSQLEYYKELFKGKSLKEILELL